MIAVRDLPGFEGREVVLRGWVHGGFGLGIERTLALICGLKHVRETIPFPRLMGRMTPQSGAEDHGSTF